MKQKCWERSNYINSWFTNCFAEKICRLSSHRLNCSHSDNNCSKRYHSNPITQLWYWMLILQLLGLNDFLTPLVMALLVGDTLPEMDNGTRLPEPRIRYCRLPSKQQCYLNPWQQCQKFPSCIRIKECSCPMLLKFTALMGTDESDMAGTPAKV